MHVPKQYEVLFDQVRHVAALRLEEAVRSVLAKISDDLIGRPGADSSRPAQAALAQAGQVLRDEMDSRSQPAACALEESRVGLRQAPAQAEGGLPSASHELIAEAPLSDQIAAQTLAARARDAMREAYPAYLGRLTQLTGTVIDEDRCPLAAKALATAFVRALDPFSSDALTRDEVQAALLQHAVIPICEIIAAADRTMAEFGTLASLPRIAVFPGLRKTPQIAAGEKGTVVPATVEQATMAGARNPRPAFRQAALLPGVESLENDAVAFAHRVGQPPYSTAARLAFFSQLRRQMEASGVEAAQLATLDLVAVMFDYATDNDRLPEPARPLLWRLQTPSVTLACLDPGYLSDEPRSVRRLVEHVAAIATAYPDDVARGGELFGRLQTVVRAAEVVAHALQVRSHALAEQVSVAHARAFSGMRQLVSRASRERLALQAQGGLRNRRDHRRRPSKEEESAISRKIESLLAERLHQRSVPETVSAFLKVVWLRHLRTAVLRDGENSAGYQAALKVVDDLLWTIDDADPRGSRSDLAQRIPLMLKILTQGISDIGAREEDYQPFLDEMFLIHLRRIQQRRDPAGNVASATGSAAALLYCGPQQARSSVG